MEPSARSNASWTGSALPLALTACPNARLARTAGRNCPSNSGLVAGLLRNGFIASVCRELHLKSAVANRQSKMSGQPNRNAPAGQVALNLADGIFAKVKDACS